MTPSYQRIQECIKNIVMKKVGIDNIPYSVAGMFVKYRNDRYDPVRFNYRDKAGRAFFENESKGNLYIYTNAKSIIDSRGLDVEFYKKSILAFKRRKGDSFETHEFNDIQVVIDGIRVRNLSLDDVLMLVSRKIVYAAYSYFIYYMKCIIIDDVTVIAKAKSIIKYTKVPSHEQTPIEARLVGLLLWDMVYSGGESLAKAIAKVQALESGHCRSASDRRTLSRDYELADMCIRNRHTFNYEDLKKNNKKYETFSYRTNPKR